MALAFLFSGCSDKPKGFYVELEVIKVHRCVTSFGVSECVITGINWKGDEYTVNVHDLTAVGDMVYRTWKIRGGEIESYYLWRTDRSQTVSSYRETLPELRNYDYDETLLY